jgi:lipopolysaccharide/colanic/teichoic acid biosynthesis glycosyltransferase
MLSAIGTNLKKQWVFFSLYLAFILLLVGFLNSYEKIEGHKLINSNWSEFQDSIFPAVTYIGDGAMAGLVILFLLFYKLRFAFMAMVSFALSAGITQFLKQKIFPNSDRPFLEMWEYFHSGDGHLVADVVMRRGNSFPSGHTTSAFSIFCLLTLITNKKWLGAVFFLLAALAGFSRVYLSQHFAEDVLLGSLIGTGVTLIVVSLFQSKKTAQQWDKGLSLKRAFDLVSSIIVLIIGLPFFLIIALLVGLTSKGGVFFIQKRVGKDNLDFGLLKFRTMKLGAEAQGQITVGGRDPRITKVGYYLRKFKMDEFPQLFNIIAGQMSVVGPRPEVRKYVDLYSNEQLKVLSVKPGLTDYASIVYINENEVLGAAADPEKVYIDQVMPVKLRFNLKYISQQTFWLDIKLIFQTFGKVFKK